MTTIAANRRALCGKITAAAHAAHCKPADITVVAVGKTQPASSLAAAYRAGFRHFGENYLSEARDKMAALAELPIVWHFIGAIQANKTAPIARAFQWAHSIDRLKIARRLAAARFALMEEQNAPPLNICIEINIDGEPNKSGVAPAAAGELASAVSRLPGLALRGLMAMPAPHTAASQQRAAFRKVRELRDAIAGRENLCLDVLSMGMSGDYQAAIQEGATMLRIGTAIFGARATKQAAANGG